MTRSKPPLNAYDARYLLTWLRASREVVVIGEVDPTMPGWEEGSKRLTQFNVSMNAVRKRAEEENHPGWQDLRRSTMRMRKHRGRIIWLACAPRDEDMEDLLSRAVGGVAAPSRAKREVSPELLAVPDDILEGLFPEEPQVAQSISPTSEKIA